MINIKILNSEIGIFHLPEFKKGSFHSLSVSPLHGLVVGTSLKPNNEQIIYQLDHATLDENNILNSQIELVFNNHCRENWSSLLKVGFSYDGDYCFIQTVISRIPKGFLVHIPSQQILWEPLLFGIKSVILKNGRIYILSNDWCTLFTTELFHFLKMKNKSQKCKLWESEFQFPSIYEYEADQELKRADFHWFRLHPKKEDHYGFVFFEKKIAVWDGRAAKIWLCDDQLEIIQQYQIESSFFPVTFHENRATDSGLLDWNRYLFIWMADNRLFLFDLALSIISPLSYSYKILGPDIMDGINYSPYFLANCLERYLLVYRATGKLSIHDLFSGLCVWEQSWSLKELTGISDKHLKIYMQEIQVHDNSIYVVYDPFVLKITFPLSYQL